MRSSSTQDLTQDLTQEQDLTFCFEVHGERVGSGRAYASVKAPTVEVARARMAPLFRGCELVPVEHPVLPEFASC